MSASSPVLMLLLLSVLTAWANKECGQNEKCINQDQCPDFLEMKAAWKRLIKNSLEKKEATDELREQVCDKNIKGVCCASGDQEGVECRSRRGAGQCSTLSCCRGSTGLSPTCGAGYTCCPSAWGTCQPVAVRNQDPPPHQGRVPTGRPRRGPLCGLDSEVTPTVFNGEKAKEGQFPFMVSLVWRIGRGREVYSFCGGVLITSRHVLTAGHCFNTITERDWKSRAIDVRIGLSDLSNRELAGNSANIAAVTVHKDFRRRGVGVADDIAIVTLDRDVEGITACLPTEYQSFQNKTAVVAGWGRTEQGVVGKSVSELRYAALDEVSVTECQRRYDILLTRSRKKAYLTRKQLCAGNNKADACSGDSGGPLLHINTDGRWMVAGIVSFGPSSCGQRVPGVFTKVASYLSWIRENTGVSWI